MYKQQPKSPMLKALKGNQGKLPQQLQDAIKAAPESPAKQTKTLQKIKRTPETEGEKKAAQRAAQAKISSDSTYTYNQLRESNSWYGEAGKASAEASSEKAGRDARTREAKRSAAKMYGKSPAKQTTAGEFAHKKSLKEKEMGKSTKVVDKFTSALEAPFSDKTYSELKKEKRAKQKAKYDAKSPVKQTEQRVRTGTPALPPSKRRVPPAPKVPVGPKAEKPKTKKETLTKQANKKRYK